MTWRDELAKVLRHAAGHEVPVADIRRLGGRFVDGRTRPVLVTFQSCWDRRLVLSGARRLADETAMRNVYIKPDESVEERRRAQLKLVYSRAVREGKNARLDENMAKCMLMMHLCFA